ncbi:FtsW/RodA/SpoVE family cell cycle protein [Daejeonella oryzae]|uniref:FtsW/RodA/SpoVE family cell cycle protein n=1 Tax=Daejeonella oryzae TaxID=1122943 RepID=UPI0003F8CF29|nr:FtsW/RodA/SpoVE family cell cycle protein [Daejeonella oryzae]
MIKNLPATNRKRERIFLILIGFVFLLLFFSLYNTLQKDFSDVSRRLADGTMVNLNEGNPGERIKTLLEKGYYFEDKKDIQLIESVVEERLPNKNSQIDNTGEINKRKYTISADEAYTRGGESFKKRVKASRSLLGFTGNDSLLFDQERTKPQSFSSTTNLAAGQYTLSGTILNKDEKPVSGVVVRLQMIIPQDSISSDMEEVEKVAIESTSGITKVFIQDENKLKKLQSLTAYARTNDNGEFAFSNLPDEKAYRVLPLQPGFQFGTSQGIQKLDENVSFRFLQSPHTIRLLSPRDFTILKKEKSLIVRTPDEFNRWYWIIAASFIVSFLLLHVIISRFFPQADQLILPFLMIMTGLSFLTLLSLQDPLRDRFLAKNTLTFFGIGMAGICALLLFNVRKFNADSLLYRMFIFKSIRKAANGWPWIALAIVLLASTIVLGTGPEGSGVKVNLFGIQPSEIVKYLVILFLAGFFTANEKFISQYPSLKKRWSFFSFALIAIFVCLLLFLLLGDLGPAMVVCFTFIILFSFSRGDFMFMIASVVFYVLANWILKSVWLSAGLTVFVLILVTLFKRKQLSESAIMVLIIMAGFLTIDQIPQLNKIFPGPVQRLVERKAIWLDAWNNEVYGGDQVANGIWAMSSGGLTGQGIGQGFAKTIPEAHTDMILPSIGEEFGWAGIISVFILFILYLHRSIIIGRQTGMTFLFYLCAGIGICTFVQFLLIAGGSTGALPLSGVSLPFQSYGGSSLVVNMLAAGFLLSASLTKGTVVQMTYVSTQHDRNLVPALAAAFIGILLLTASVSRYFLNNTKWVVKPSLVADKSGARMFSYNPRISILMNKLEAGSLYDRQGRILATSKPDLIRKQKNILREAGISNYDIDSAEHKRLDRYYPFEEQMFFWIGDANTGVFNGSVNGYFAEYEHSAELRGFETTSSKFDVIANRYREDRFLARGVKEMTVSKKDYSALGPLLIAGINSEKVESFKNQNRDVQLTMDAGLQTSIQKSISLDDSLKDNRVSVVIMEGSSGDVIASAMYPLPETKNWERLTMSPAEQNNLSEWTSTQDLGFTYASQPGSTAKVLTALAAFNKMGEAAADKKYSVSAFERIRTKGPEPDETGLINMQRAIVKSNNVFFIKLANEEHLQNEMTNLYMKTGMFLHGVGGYYYGKKPGNSIQESKWRELWEKTEFNSKPRYNPANIRRTRAKGISGMSWGQGELIATPASVARLAAGISNNGIMLPDRYVLKAGNREIPTESGTKLANSSEYARLLTNYMKEQSAPKAYTLGISVAGKTGTPERIWKGKGINDGWYVFFAPKANGPGNMVVCVRIESTKGSSDAVQLAGKHVVPLLIKKGYIKSFARNSLLASSAGKALN